MIKQINTKSGDILVVEIPKDVTWWNIIENALGKFITKTLELNPQFLQYGKHSKMFGEDIPNQVYYDPDNFYLPEGKWNIIGKLSELNEEACEQFVDKMYINYGTTKPIHFGYNNHIKKKNKLSLVCSLVKESFLSLLQSKGIDMSKEYLIIKKN